MSDPEGSGATPPVVTLPAVAAADAPPPSAVTLAVGSALAVGLAVSPADALAEACGTLAAAESVASFVHEDSPVTSRCGLPAAQAATSASRPITSTTRDPGALARTVTSDETRSSTPGAVITTFPASAGVATARTVGNGFQRVAEAIPRPTTNRPSSTLPVCRAHFSTDHPFGTGCP